MDENENFKNILNNLKNLSGGMNTDPESTEQDNYYSNTLPRLKFNKDFFMKNSDDGSSSLAILLTFFGLFSFLNPFFYLVRVNEKFDANFNTMISIHSICFLVIFIVFFIIVLPHFNLHSDTIDKKGINLFKVNQVFTVFIVFLLFATMIIISKDLHECDNYDKNKNKNEEEEEEGGEEQSKCKNIDSIGGGKTGDYKKSILGMLVTQILMSIVIFTQTRSTDEIINKINDDLKADNKTTEDQENIINVVNTVIETKLISALKDDFFELNLVEDDYKNFLTNKDNESNLKQLLNKALDKIRNSTITVESDDNDNNNIKKKYDQISKTNLIKQIVEKNKDSWRKESTENIYKKILENENYIDQDKENLKIFKFTKSSKKGKNEYLLLNDPGQTHYFITDKNEETFTTTPITDGENEVENLTCLEENIKIKSDGTIIKIVLTYQSKSAIDHINPMKTQDYFNVITMIKYDSTTNEILDTSYKYDIAEDNKIPFHLQSFKFRRKIRNVETTVNDTLVPKQECDPI